MTSPSAGPSPRTIGCGSASSTVTSSPRCRHVAATSAPMKPAPITTTGGPRSSWRAERERVVERAQREHALEVRAGSAGGARAEPVAIDSPSNVDDARRRRARPARSASVEREWRARPSRQSRSRSSTPCLRSTMSSGSGSPGEQLLRQRRPVVRQVRLGADRDDRAVVALAPQRLRGAQARERHADDRDRAQREPPPRGSAGPYRDVISVLRDACCEWPGI